MAQRKTKRSQLNVNNSILFMVIDLTMIYDFNGKLVEATDDTLVYRT